MNIIEARARTADGQKYRRIGEDWYVVKGQENIHGYLSSRSAVATDWYPDPPGPWVGIDLGEDAEINEADREFLAGDKWTAKQISDMVKNTKPGPIEFKTNYVGDMLATEAHKDWLQRNTKRIEDLERDVKYLRSQDKATLGCLEDHEKKIRSLQLKAANQALDAVGLQGPQVDVKNLLDRVIAVEGWLSKLEIRSGRNSNQLWDIKKSLLRSNGSPPNCHDEHARNQFSMLRKRVQSLESFEKRFEVWSYSLVDKWTENLRKLARGLNKVEAWQNAHSGATAPQERGKGK